MTIQSSKKPLIGPNPEFLANLMIEIEKKCSSVPQSLRFAAFDADGTLWDSDIGENFFEFQIQNCGLALPADPWKHYRELKKQYPPLAYTWLATINAGFSLQQVRGWAKSAIDRQSISIFESQRQLIEFLRKLEFKIFVVTASVKWAVEPAAALLGFSFDEVLGVCTNIENGLVSSAPVEPITWRQGKATALLNATGGVRPLFCSGNTLGDIALLELSEGPCLAIRSQPEPLTNEAPSPLYLEEIQLWDAALKNHWHRHAFR